MSELERCLCGIEALCSCGFEIQVLNKKIVSLGEEVKVLEEKLKGEHENFLAVHRDNMKLSARNVGLFQENASLKEKVKELEFSLRLSESQKTKLDAQITSIRVELADIANEECTCEYLDHVCPKHLAKEALTSPADGSELLEVVREAEKVIEWHLKNCYAVEKEDGGAKGALSKLKRFV